MRKKYLKRRSSTEVISRPSIFLFPIKKILLGVFGLSLALSFTSCDERDDKTHSEESREVKREERPYSRRW